MADIGKHTPGPWEYREISPYDDGIGYISADGHDIIHAGVSDLPAEENRANGRLQAAAPELLASCIEFISGLGPDGYYPHAGKPATDRMRAAISKAEGRS